MLQARFAADLTEDALRARQDSQVLWRELILALPVAPDIEAAPSRALDIAGRYQVGDGNEFPCRLTEISSLGLRIKGPERGRVGKLCAANISGVGIVEGLVAEVGEDSLVFGVIASPRRLQRLAMRFSWQMRRDAEALEERRRSERVEMKQAQATLKTQDGQVFSCEIFDLSDGGAAVHVGASALYFWVGQPVTFNERSGRVLRYFPGGLVIKFD